MNKVFLLCGRPWFCKRAEKKKSSSQNNHTWFFFSVLSFERQTFESCALPLYLHITSKREVEFSLMKISKKPFNSNNSKAVFRIAGFKKKKNAARLLLLQDLLRPAMKDPRRRHLSPSPRWRRWAKEKMSAVRVHVNHRICSFHVAALRCMQC